MRSLALTLLASLVCGACTSPSNDAPQPALLAGSGNFDDAVRGVLRVSLHPRARIVRPEPGQSALRLQQEMDRAIRDVLEERGIALVRPRTGEERIVAYAIGVEGELNDQEMVEIFGISPGVDNQDAKVRGGIVLVVIHAKTGRILWRGSGSGQGRGPGEGTPERSAVIRDAVRSVMEGRRTQLER